MVFLKIRTWQMLSSTLEMGALSGGFTEQV